MPRRTRAVFSPAWVAPFKAKTGLDWAARPDQLEAGVVGCLAGTGPGGGCFERGAHNISPQCGQRMSLSSTLPPQCGQLSVGTVRTGGSVVGATATMTADVRMSVPVF